MSYQKKYYYNFKDLNNIPNTVEIWQNYTGGTLTPELVFADKSAFSIELPAIKDKFQAVRGTGCECNIISYNGMEFLTGLYSSDMQNIMIKHYYNSNINWLGYINSELQSEPYDVLNNYTVNFNGNDGFSIMDKMYYCTGSGYVVGTTFNGANIIDGSLYTGVTSQFNILQTIFQKVGLPFNLLKICVSTTFSGQTIANGNTIFHQTYVDNANYINEDGTPETLRKVLESILEPYGCIIFQLAGNIIITDIHNLASNSSFTFQDFSMTGSTFSYIGTENITNNVVTLQSIKYTGTGANIEISGGKNKQTVAYSPYILKDVLPSVLQSYKEFNCTIPSTYTTGYTYTSNTTLLHQYKLLYNHYNLNVYTGTTSGTAIGFQMGFDSAGGAGNWKPDSNGLMYYLYWQNNGSGYVNKICDLINKPNITATALQSNALAVPNYVINSGAGLKISGKIWINDNSSTVYQLIGLRLEVTVGNYKNGVNSAGNGFGFIPTSGTTYYVQANNSNYTNINNTWVNICDWSNNSDIIIPIDKNISGVVNVSIYSDFYLVKGMGFKDALTGQIYNGTSVANPTSVTEIRISDLSVEVVDISTYYTMVKNDVEYVGYLNTNFQDEASKVSLICGTAATPIDRGKLMYSGSTGYNPIYNWTRNSTTANIENLLINSLTSNNKRGYYTLTNLNLHNNFNILNLLADNTYLSGKQFMLNSFKIDYEDATINCSAVEITADQNTLTSIVNQN